MFVLVVVGGGVPGTRSRAFCGGVLYSKRLVFGSTSRDKRLESKSAATKRQGKPPFTFFSSFSVVVWRSLLVVFCWLLSRREIDT